MKLMDGHMKSLAKEASAASVLGSDKWCGQIVPIYFNAWRYSDSNLWASLVTQIFDKLFARVRPKENEFKLLQEQLKEGGRRHHPSWRRGSGPLRGPVLLSL
jgi:hypothetical protein